MDFTSANLTAGQLNAIVKKLGGHEAAMRFLRGELVVSVAAPREFPIWKTVTLGVHKSAGGYIKALKAAKHRIGDWANDILGKAEFTCAGMETDVDLVVLSVADLGFKEGARYSQICEKAVEMGLALCPAEVGPALRLAYTDQPRGEWVVIAMKAITDSHRGLLVFYLEHVRVELWLSGNLGRPDDFWSSDGRFVFVRRK